MTKPVAVASIVLSLVLVVGSVWFRVAAPCSWYGWGSVSDLPARCLMHP